MCVQYFRQFGSHTRSSVHFWPKTLAVTARSMTNKMNINKPIYDADRCSVALVCVYSVFYDVGPWKFWDDFQHKQHFVILILYFRSFFCGKSLEKTASKLYVCKRQLHFRFESPFERAFNYFRNNYFLHYEIHEGISCGIIFKMTWKTHFFIVCLLLVRCTPKSLVLAKGICRFFLSWLLTVDCCYSLECRAKIKLIYSLQK